MPDDTPAAPAEFELGPLTLRFPRRGDQVAFCLLPTRAASRTVDRRPAVTGGPECPPGGFGAEKFDPMVHVKTTGTPYPSGFAAGLSMHGCEPGISLALQDQRLEATDHGHRLLTHLATPAGLRATQVMAHRDGEAGLWLHTELRNDTDAPITLEYLTSFCLGGLSPFAVDDAPERLWIHRAHSFWSAEGRLDSRPLEDMHLERSWVGHARIAERFGQVGSLPVRQWFPFVALEDRDAGVTWAAQVAWAGSWQLEINRHSDNISITGGHADREFGHWLKTLQPGESISTPQVLLTAVEGDVDDACHALTRMMDRDIDAQPSVEADLPIICNEYCSSWGKPSHESLLKLTDVAHDAGCTYMVIDAGWYADVIGDWGGSHGDWIPNTELFPQGIKATADAIRARGMIPGIWFEMETFGHKCKTAQEKPDWALQRDGQMLVDGARRFWDMRQDCVQDYLGERVIGLLRDAGFGYMKVDYNATIGIGCDGAESLGEGLRQNTLGSYKFWQRVRRELPDLVLETCASGGHRLEPSMLRLAAQASFSDAHECAEIPVIAANCHRFLQPRQNQIWAVLRARDDLERIAYSLAAGFLGRLCVSGELHDLSADQLDLLKQATALYKTVTPTLKYGRSHRYGPALASYRHPKGWQAMLRVSDSGDQAFVVVHSYGGELPDRVQIPLPSGRDWRIRDSYSVTDRQATIAGGHLDLALGGRFRGAVYSLES